MLVGGGLKRTSLGRHVRFSSTQSTVIDGPFQETDEKFWLLVMVS